MIDLLKGNILDPLTFVQGEIDLFIRDNSCGLCGGFLYKDIAPGRKFVAKCPEHGVVMSHTHISKHKAKKTKQSVIDGKHELRPEPTEPRDEKTILAELGF